MTLIDAVEHLIRRIDLIIIKAFEVFMTTLAATIVVLMNYAVFSRYVLRSSVGWSEELPAYLLAVMTFVGAAWVTRTNGHLSFDPVVRKLPRGAQTVVQIFNLLLVSVFGSLLFRHGLRNALGYGSRTLISLDIPIWIFRMSLPIGAGLMVLMSVVRILGMALGRIGPEHMDPQEYEETDNNQTPIA